MKKILLRSDFEMIKRVRNIENHVARNDKLLKGNKLAYSAALQNRYIQGMRKILEKFIDSVEKAVVGFFKSAPAKEYFSQDASVTSDARKLINKLTEIFNNIFLPQVKPLAEKMVDESVDASEVSLKSSLKKLTDGVSINTAFLTADLDQVIKASISENVALITSIGQQYHANIEKAVLRSITTGNGLDDLIPFMQKQRGISKRHARNVALDQTRKIYNQINRGRMEAVGTKKFIWLHSAGGQKPRKSHIALSGKVFSFDDLPVINKEQVDAGYEAPVRGIPGQAINCGCTMMPVVEFDT